jgi:hypothetical protein
VGVGATEVNLLGDYATKEDESTEAIDLHFANNTNHKFGCF